MKKYNGFTLAEVLITIGIVGVVAAITIPTLIQNTNSKRYSTHFKKALSTLNQAAISAHAHYDTDYASLTTVSDPSACATDSLSGGQSTMCALLNSTLSVKNYMGVYGEVSGTKADTPYSFTKTTDGFDPTNFLIYSLSDGAIVGFNPNMKSCSLEPGQIVNKALLTDTDGLASCMGFVDVNGVTLPNKEVTCADGTSSLDADNACTLKTTGSKVGDVYPIVFHDGTVEPATNAGKSEIGAGKGETKSGSRTLTLDGAEYKYLSGKWYHEDGQGNIVDYNGNKYTKTSDGYERKNGSYTYKYDNDMNTLGYTYNGQWYDYKNGSYVRDYGNGNLVDIYGSPYIKTSDGYERETSYYTYKYDNDLNVLGYTKYDGQWYDYKNGNYYRDYGNYIRDVNGYATYNKTSDGYEHTSANGLYTYKYDNGLTPLGHTYNGQWYDYKGSSYVRDDGNGNLVTASGTTYTKRDDGLYEYNGQIYDENLNRIK